MKLSEAIRLGGMLSHHQITGIFNDQDGGTCALGGAMLATNSIEPLKEWFMEFSHIDGCNICGLPMPDVPTLVTHLNDSHLLSREEIADEVEKIENNLSKIQKELVECQKS